MTASSLEMLNTDVLLERIASNEDGQPRTPEAATLALGERHALGREDSSACVGVGGALVVALVLLAVVRSRAGGSRVRQGEVAGPSPALVVGQCLSAVEGVRAWEVRRESCAAGASRHSPGPKESTRRADVR